MEVYKTQIFKNYFDMLVMVAGSFGRADFFYPLHIFISETN